MLIVDAVLDKLERNTIVHDTAYNRERGFTAEPSPKYAGGATIRGHRAYREVGGKPDTGVPNTQTGSGGVNVLFQHLSIERDAARDDVVLGYGMDPVDGRVLGWMGDSWGSATLGVSLCARERTIRAVEPVFCVRQSPLSED